MCHASVAHSFPDATRSIRPLPYEGRYIIRPEREMERERGDAMKSVYTVLLEVSSRVTIVPLHQQTKVVIPCVSQKTTTYNLACVP